MSPGTVLGFDFGLRRIGVAVGQTLTGTARPLVTLRSGNDGPDWEAIARLVEQWQPQILVVGLPVHMDGNPHELSAAVQGFAAQLHDRHGLPVEFIDESLSSHAAQQMAMGGGAPADRVAKERLDRLAAQVILETWLTQHGSAS